MTPEEPVQLPESRRVIPDANVKLPSGNPLDVLQASKILRESFAPIVLLAGAVKAGKTTLLASVHDAFQRGPFAGYLAVGSQTLMGFEERCFDSRHSSRSAKPATIRTQHSDGFLYYHLAVRREELDSPARQLLLLDMSGEYYERATDSAAEAKNLTPTVQRADHFVHLVNAARLASSVYRAHTQSNVSILMRRLYQFGVLDASARVDVLLTKWDVVMSVGGEALAAETLDLAERLFPDRDRAKVRRLRITPVAARPHYRSSLEPAFNLENLFRNWVEETPKKLEVTIREVPVPQSSDPFDTFSSV
jgi:hypothetical protein